MSLWYLLFYNILLLSSTDLEVQWTATVCLVKNFIYEGQRLNLACQITRKRVNRNIQKMVWMVADGTGKFWELIPSRLARIVSSKVNTDNSWRNFTLRKSTIFWKCIWEGGLALRRLRHWLWLIPDLTRSPDAISWTANII